MAKRLPKKKSPPTQVSVAQKKTVSWEFWLPRVALIAGLTLWIYWPALSGDFIWDDGWYLTTNPLMRGWIGLWKFWFQPGSWVEYYPIQETVQWMQWQLWGKNPLGYHLTNVLLHIINSLLVWRLLSKFGLKRAWLGGLLFAVQPVQVESVAWISELKNTLSLPFFLASMFYWIDYEEHKRKSDYEAAVGLFFVAMLCKITMAPFPFVILLYAWWKRGAIHWSDCKAAAPFFVISVTLGLLGYWAGSHYRLAGNAQPENIPLGGFLSRFDGIGLITVVYFTRFFLPWDELLAYPQWQVHPQSAIEYLPWLFILGAIYVLWTKRKSWGRHALLGGGFFLLMLAPFLGFLAISYMTFTWVMDHFLYLPIIGLIGVVIAGLDDFEERFPTDRPYLMGAFTIIISLMALESRAFANLFTNEKTLWGYVLKRNPTLWLAHHDLGCALMDQGRYEEALPHLQEVVRLVPDLSDGYYNLGLDLSSLGRLKEGGEMYQRAMEINPKDGKPYINLAENALKEGNTTEAIGLYRQALVFVPGMAQVHYDLGSALLRAGQLHEAIEEFGMAVNLAPGFAQAHENLGSTLAQSGNLPAAIGQFQAAIQIDSGYIAARNNLGLALAQSGRVPEAIEQFQQVLQIDPDNASARQSLMKLQAFQAAPATK